MDEQMVRLNKVSQRLSSGYATVDRITMKVFANDYDPRLIEIRRARTKWHLDRLVEMGRAERKMVGDMPLYRRKRGSGRREGAE